MTRLFPELGIVSALWFEAKRRFHAARRSDRGASALEWAVIAAIAGGAALFLGNIILNKVTQKSNEVGGL